MEKSLIAGRHVLIIENDSLTQKLLARIFNNAGASVTVASDGFSGLKQFYIQRPDLVVLNVHLPGMDGWHVCQRIREETDVPLLFLMASYVDPETLAFEPCKKANFLQKPFTPSQLLAWAGRALYHSRKVFTDGQLHVNLARREVTWRGEPVSLSPTEFRLLEFLVQHAGMIMTYEQILRQVWGWNEFDNPSVVHVYISRLRQKIETDPQNPRYLLLKYGVGYRFVWPE